jgi:hypothetical protein
LNPVYIVVSAVLLFLIALLVSAASRRLVRGRAQQRRVELPNSHYTSPVVRSRELRHRWSGISLDGIHEINRTEVMRLLALVEAMGVDALQPAERVFLDHVAPVTPADVGPDLQDRTTAPELRPHPA